MDKLGRPADKMRIKKVLEEFYRLGNGRILAAGHACHTALHHAACTACAVYRQGFANCVFGMLFALLHSVFTNGFQVCTGLLDKTC